ncbi:MAG TPA: hypothetical protein VD969_05595 [Symbiobacteriaceae bacterium]|nr:hypothetical protein [Symbiobacteriaceae bacterium]
MITMNYGFYGKPFGFGKPIGFVAGARPYVIGPGFATYPAFPATIAKGFAKAIPVTSVAVAPWGKFGAI